MSNKKGNLGDAPEVSHNIASALGADYVVELGAPVVIAPESLAVLATLFSQRLRSAGGRPSDPNWSLSRQVPFAVSTWDRLGEVADAISAQGRRVARGQLAAILIESGLAAFETSPEALDEFLSQSDDSSNDGLVDR